jgi:hypothetical protein
MVSTSPAAARQELARLSAGNGHFTTHADINSAMA